MCLFYDFKPLKSMKVFANIFLLFLQILSVCHNRKYVPATHSFVAALCFKNCFRSGFVFKTGQIHADCTAGPGGTAGGKIHILQQVPVITAFDLVKDIDGRIIADRLKI